MPFPLANWGAQAETFRQIELTGSKFTGILKAEIFMIPLILLTSFMYWSYIWKLAPIPLVLLPLRPDDVAASGAPEQRLVHRHHAGRGGARTVRRYRILPAEQSARRQLVVLARPAPPPTCTSDDHEQRAYGPWSRVGYFYTNFKSPDKPLVPAAPG